MNYKRFLCCVAAVLLIGAMKAEPCSAQRVVVYSPGPAPVFAPLRPAWVAPAFAPRLAVPVPRAVAYRMATPVTYAAVRPVTYTAARPVTYTTTTYRTYYAPTTVVYRPAVYATRVY